MAGDALANAFNRCFFTHIDKLAYRFLTKNLDVQQSITFGELAQRAQGLAARIHQQKLTHERVLVIAEPGIAFIVALLACFFAGAVAVPVPFPHSRRAKARFHAVCYDAAPKAMLVDRFSLEETQQLVTLLGAGSSPPVIEIDSPVIDAPDNGPPPDIKPIDLAFIQYTSGSTGDAKGVNISRENLLSQLQLIAQRFELSSESVLFSWLPPYHDMGLVGCLLTPLVIGYECNFTAPINFISQPMLWLQGISRYEATISGGPNFAYELCLEKSQPEHIEALDLSNWKVAFNGAEPLRAVTMRNFADVFAPAGFRYSAFLTCYGLAEATLMVSAADVSSEPVTLRVNKAFLLARGEVEATPYGELELVSSGLIAQPIKIICPQSGQPKEEGRVGEVWVTGSSVAQGYWSKGQALQQRFNGKVPDDPGRYFKTGDAGFVLNEQLFITGRLSDLIIVNGKNYPPQYIEYTVEKSHHSLKPQACAAVQIDVDGCDEVIIVAESRTRESEQLRQAISAIRNAVAAEHGIRVFDIALVRSGTLLRTSSGKIRRKDVGAAWRQQALHRLLQGGVPLSGGSGSVPPRAGLETSIAHIAQQILKQESINADDSFFELGGDSIASMQLAARLEQEFGVEIRMEWVLDNPTVTGLANIIAAELSKGVDDHQLEHLLDQLHEMSEAEIDQLLKKV
ncbi:AMP-binding protein [Pectobacteriaceae bacterium CE90]|nr:AMP-binding protein [Pectobacteriaceae bacterium CE90]